MSQEEINDNFSFERKKHFDFFLPYYQERNWQVFQDNINSNHKNDWDVKLEVFAGQFVLVDEKAIRKEWNDLLVEIIQDLETGNLGWFYSKKDWILYGSWGNIENTYPTSLYMIKSKELKEYINSLDGFIKTCISKKGWGITYSLILNWEVLINKQIAEKLL
jgi:hypothetical protein